MTTKLARHGVDWCCLSRKDTTPAAKSSGMSSPSGTRRAERPQPRPATPDEGPALPECNKGPPNTVPVLRWASAQALIHLTHTPPQGFSCRPKPMAVYHHDQYKLMEPSRPLPGGQRPLRTTFSEHLSVWSCLSLFPGPRPRAARATQSQPMRFRAR